MRFPKQLYPLPMAGGALDALCEKVIGPAGYADGVARYPVGPITGFTGSYGSSVQTIDLFGRLPISNGIAVVVWVSATPTGAGVTGDIGLESDDADAFPSPKLRFSRLAVLTPTSGPRGNGTGFHYLGHITGPMERHLRFVVTPHGTTPDLKQVKCYLTPDWQPEYFV